jgi:hypothetical protein
VIEREYKKLELRVHLNKTQYELLLGSRSIAHHPDRMQAPELCTDVHCTSAQTGERERDAFDE